jgi:Cullin family
MLAEYVDAFIIKNGKASDDSMNEEIDKIFDLIKLTAERDIFIYYYEIALKGRLLSVTHYYEDMENDFLKKLN